MRVVEAAAGLSASSFGGTATTVIVFVPVLFLPGLLGALFGDLAISLIASVTAGWLYAQLALPSLFLLCAPAGGRSVPFPALEAVYARALERVMRRPRRAALVAAAVSLAGGALLAGRPFVFRAEAAARELVARVEYPAGTELAFIGREAARLGAALNGLACVQSVFGRAGAEEEDAARRADAAYTPETLTLRCVLKKSARGEDAAGAVRECLAREAEGAPVVSVDMPEDAVQTMLGLSAARRLVVKAGEPDVAAARAAAWCASLREEAAGFFQAAVRVPAGGRQALRLVPRREAAAQAGLSAARIAEAAASVTEGFVASEMTIEGRPVDIRLLGAPPETPARAPAAAIEAIPVSGGAQAVSLGTVARLERCETPRVLPRQDRSDVVYIIPYAARGGEKKLNAVINKMTQKTRYVRGEDESFFKRYGVSLLVTLALVLALLYMVMGAQFESFALPLIFMLTIPFSLAGTGPALFLAGKPVDSGAILALVVLFGLVVNNGIVLYETSERHRSGGLAPDEAVKKGARERFRAVLTTTLTTVVVLLPLAFSPLARAEGAMALAMLGGCLAGTALTVFALPPVFARYFARVRSPA
jgi:multidrug efflux pump subunit AcrB